MSIVYLNVGGCYYVTRASTLDTSNTFFSGLISNADHTELFIDRDPTHFRHILNWLRGVRYLPENDTILSELMFEADFYCMPDMVEAIRSVRGVHPSVHKTLYELCRNAAS
jgi:hypothetical protein